MLQGLLGRPVGVVSRCATKQISVICEMSHECFDTRLKSWKCHLLTASGVFVDAVRNWNFRNGCLLGFPKRHEELEFPKRFVAARNLLLPQPQRVGVLLSYVSIIVFLSTS